VEAATAPQLCSDGKDEQASSLKTPSIDAPRVAPNAVASFNDAIVKPEALGSSSAPLIDAGKAVDLKVAASKIKN